MKFILRFLNIIFMKICNFKKVIVTIFQTFQILCQSDLG